MGKEAIQELEPVQAGPSADIWDEIWARVKGDTWTDPDPVDEPPMTPDQPSEEQIRLRAYELYLLRGQGHGYAEEDWYAAKRELQALSESPA